ncbi:MAG: hypothetical protein D3903_07565 [Candidatus Electrothrix sp. GM3_4]|nr:hypothetical protein [Candidatus Electrothrix sp. GM3_4]
MGVLRCPLLVREPYESPRKVFGILFFSYHEVIIADIQVKANEFPLLSCLLVYLPGNCQKSSCGTFIDFQGSTNLYFPELFFFSFSKIMLCWGISRCRRSVVSATRLSLFFRENVS